MTYDTNDETIVTETQPASTPETVETPVVDTDALPEEAKAETQADEKKFNQSELNEIIKKEKAKAEARAERRALKVYADRLEAMNRQPAQTNQPAPDGKPRLEQFANPEDYVEAVTDWKLGQHELTNQRKQQEYTNQQNLERTEKLYAQAEKIPGFDREEFDSLPLTPMIAQTIVDSDVPAKLMAHLVNHPEELDRIITLPPARQAVEIGKLEGKLSAVAPVKTSKAPDPIDPIGSKGSSAKSPEDMTPAEFAKWRKGFQRKAGYG
jgi:hypothetical protein